MGTLLPAVLPSYEDLRLTLALLYVCTFDCNVDSKQMAGPESRLALVCCSLNISVGKGNQQVSVEIMVEASELFHPLDLWRRIFSLVYLKLSNLTIKIS